MYTHAGPGWYLDDHDPDAPRSARRSSPTSPRSASPSSRVHKGLSGGSPFASPVDIGPAAADHPDIAFVVYHSGYETGYREGAYDAPRQRRRPA